MGASNHLLRLTSVAYGDGLSSMRTGTDPVQVAQTVFDQDGDMPNPQGLSDLFVSWGQFADHDLSHTPDASGEMVFVPGLVAPLERSIYDPATGTMGPREHVNTITPSMDASMIYGSDADREAALRTFEGGMLGMGDDGLMILTSSGMAGASPEKQLYLSGDVRANENTGLTVLHNLFSMEHNYWADRIGQVHTDWTDEEIFQAARSIVEYEIQKITYDDWLPHLIGNAMGDYQGYDANADARISTEFSTAAFRFGHTMVSPTIKQLEENGSTSTQGDIRVQDAFFNITQLREHGLEDSLRGLTSGKAQTSDAVIIDDLNFFLENPAGVTGFSLAALNILRGRDHGLGTYVDVRAELLGDIDPATLDPTDFSIITSDQATQAKLAATYGSVLEVDLWVGGLAEDDVEGGQLGALFTHIVAEQFGRTRAADQSFGELNAQLDPAILADAKTASLSDIIVRNTGVDYMQSNAFEAVNRIGGDENNNWLAGTYEDDLILGFGGRDKLVGKDGDDHVFGGDGNDTVRGNRGEDDLHGEDGNDLLAGGRDDDRLDGGAGRDFLIGGRGNDTFVFKAGNERDMILDFGYGQDVIELSGFQVESFDQVMASARQSWWNVKIDLGDGDTLVLKNKLIWQLSEDDFSFV